MPTSTSRLVPLGTLLLALGGWGCGVDEPATGPSAEPAGATASVATYAVRDLGTLGGTGSHAYGINSTGVIVGSSNVPGSNLPHAFMWKGGVMTDLGALAGGWSEARAINDDGVMTDIGTLGGTFAQANGINRAGTVVGVSTTASGERHAFRWKDGVFKDLGTMGRQYSLATAINTKGQIVGGIGPFPDAEGEERDFADGFLYYQEVMTRLPTTSHRVTTFPRAIGPTGIVVGQGYDTGDDPREETAWYLENGTGDVLPTLDPTIELDNHAGALAVNRAGTIVGFSKAANGRSHAVLWRRQ